MRFTIRDLLWLMVVVALSFGWWREHRQIGKCPDQLRALVHVLNMHSNSVDLASDHIDVKAPTWNIWQGLNSPFIAPPDSN